MAKTSRSAEVRREHALLAAWVEVRSETHIELYVANEPSRCESLGSGDLPTPKVPGETVGYHVRRKNGCSDTVNKRGLGIENTVALTTIEVNSLTVESLAQSERLVVGEGAACRSTAPPSEPRRVGIRTGTVADWNPDIDSRCLALGHYDRDAMLRHLVSKSSSRKMGGDGTYSEWWRPGFLRRREATKPKNLSIPKRGLL